MNKQNVYDDMCNNIDKNHKIFWNMINKLDKLHTNHDSVHDIPNDNFFQFFKKINKGDDKNSKYHEFVIEQFQLLKENLGKETFDNILDNDITTQEISAAIKSLTHGKSTSPDMISNEMLKYGGPIILKSLERLLNFILNTGNFSEKWNESM